jgi:hypothetical protein
MYYKIEISSSHHKMDKVTHISNFINNFFVPTEQVIESFSPATGKLFALVPDSGSKEADMAVEAGKECLKRFFTKLKFVIK